jgi:hypothetical protein
MVAVTHTEQPADRELDAAASEGVVSNSFKTEEKTVTISVGTSEEDESYDSQVLRLTAHQCTN